MTDGVRILLIDDNDDARVTVARILEMSGYAVVQAPNAKAASLLLQQQAPDLVITDIFMPDGDGFEMLNELRDREPRIPVIAMSGGGIILINVVAGAVFCRGFFLVAKTCYEPWLAITVATPLLVVVFAMSGARRAPRGRRD